MSVYPYVEENGPKHVIDRNGVVWRLVHDGGMVTCADYVDVYSAGIEWLKRNYGPLEWPVDRLVERNALRERIVEKREILKRERPSVGSAAYYIQVGELSAYARVLEMIDE